MDFAFGDTGELTVDGDENGLRAALDNLLENAARHGARTVRVGDRTRTACIVDDDGPGIPTRTASASSSASPGAHDAARAPGSAWRSSPSRRHSTAASATIEASPLGGARSFLR